MMPWLSVKGAGIVHSMSHLAGLHAQNLLEQPPLAHNEPLPEPDLSELPTLLARYHADEASPPLRRIPRYARFGLLAALRAMNKAGWSKDAALAPHTMLALGTAHSGVQMSMDFMDSLLDAGPRLSSPTAFSHAVNNMGAGLLSLLLGVRGPCQTISQFSLSFAGALSAAALALHGGRARRALVGAVDETDPRFTRCLSTSVCHAEYPSTQGAVFLCVEAGHGEAGPQLRVHWGQHYLPGAEMTLHSGQATPEGEERPRSLHSRYGCTPLAQALDTYSLLPMPYLSRACCICTEDTHGQQASIELWRRP